MGWKHTISDFKEIAACMGYLQLGFIKDFSLRPFFIGTPSPPHFMIATQTATTTIHCSTLQHPNSQPVTSRDHVLYQTITVQHRRFIL